jgi:hypothetical protein
MPPDEVLTAVRRRPFEPFRIHVTDGSVYDISHPDMILPGRRALVVGLPGDPQRPFEHFVTIALLHVTRMEPVTAPPSGDGFTGS